MNRQLTLILLIAAIIVTNTSCKEEPEPLTDVTGKDYADLKKYFPFSGGYVWNYEITTTDFIKNKSDTFNLERRFNVEKGIFENFKDGKVTSTLHWDNSGTKLRCCTDRTLLDFDLINCDEDSTIISTKSDDPTITIFQICKPQTVAAVPDFSSIECIKTFQVNDWTDGARIFIERYYGHDIGIVYTLQHIIDSTGTIIHTQSEKLISLEK